ncbi:flagellin [Pseudovibrio brasiliensis]|uniref:ABC transporter substrate-binding protein n=1 Tax=Pseudovibrio brasiliensis TaxID=1898042 RepID=A0ABX8AI51_9HYPH|nr:flagellin [Pseudovibrio brasiliensis]QUS54753.1 ABC transporter substrate-binding protein [Pseudovibrio brasiliensis]
MADITLTAAVRTNLNTLQSTANLISDTQERLSTGKKVNSALDNPNSFFTASSLNSRASDLSNLQDDIGQSVSTLEAADKGISAIDKLLDAAKGKANQALQSKDADTRAKYAAEFNELRTQIEDIAKDSGYKGKNLLGGDGNDLLVKFNEDGSSKLNIGAVDYTDLDSSESSITLGRIGDTVGEVDAEDNKSAFKLGISADDILSAAPGTGTATETDQFRTGGDTADLSAADAIADGDDFAVGDTIKVGGEDILTIGAGTTLGDVQEAIQTEIRKTAGNQDATVAVTGGDLVIGNAAADVSVELGGNTVSVTGAGGNTDITATKLKDITGFGEGDKITVAQKDGATHEFTIGASSTVADLVADLNGAGFTDFEASFDNTTQELTIDNKSKGDNAKEFSVTYSGSETGGDFGDSSKQTISADVDAIAGRGWGSDELIEASLDQVREAQLSLRAQASTFGTNLSIVTNRQDFTADLVNTLEVGAGKLTLADSNLEGANLAALNTQNQIATSTLSLATQAGQSVLQLIR